MIKMTPDPCLGEIETIYMAGVMKMKICIISKNEKKQISKQNPGVDPEKAALKADEESDFSDLEEDLMEIGDKKKPTTNINGKDYLMYVNVHSCRDIVAADSSGTSDPYFVFRYLDKKVITSTKKETLNPVN